MDEDTPLIDQMVFRPVAYLVPTVVPKGDPTPDQIWLVKTVEIRKGWTEREHERRKREYQDGKWDVPILTTDGLSKWMRDGLSPEW